jgi:hypothetical protein
VASPKPPVEISADVRQFIDLSGKTSAVEPKLRRALRRRMKAAAEKAAVDVRAEVLKSPPSGGVSGRSRGMRRGIASGVRVTLTSTTGASRVGVVVKSTGSGLDPQDRSLARAYNKPTFRHPVFGGKSRARGFASALSGVSSGARSLDRALASRAATKWVEQKGNPYFEDVIVKHAGDVERAVFAAMDEAAASLSSGPTH